MFCNFNFYITELDKCEIDLDCPINMCKSPDSVKCIDKKCICVHVRMIQWVL